MDTDMTDYIEQEIHVDSMDGAPLPPIHEQHMTNNVPLIAVPDDGVVVSGGVIDLVYLSKCIYKNIYSRKSLTVHHVQRRLGELGFLDALSDTDGWYGDLTRFAVQSFQKSKGLDVTDDMDITTLEAIFLDDPHVEVERN